MCSTVLANNIKAWQSKNLVYPSTIFLATSPSSFGHIPTSHSFLKEPTFGNIPVFIVKSSFSLLWIIIPFFPLALHAHSMVTYDQIKGSRFLPLQNIDSYFIGKTSIPQHRVDIFTACAIHYNFNLSSVIRFIGGNYTNAHHQVESTLAALSNTSCN